MAEIIRYCPGCTLPACDHGCTHIRKTARNAARPLVVEARFEWDLGRTKVVWNIRDNSGTAASGFADSHVDAMRDAAAFVEAMAQPRVGSAFTKAELKVVK